MSNPKSLKIVLIGAGSVSFAPTMIRDIFLNDLVELDSVTQTVGQKYFSRKSSWKKGSHWT